MNIGNKEGNILVINNSQAFKMLNWISLWNVNKDIVKIKIINK